MRSGTYVLLPESRCLRRGWMCCCAGMCALAWQTYLLEGNTMVRFNKPRISVLCADAKYRPGSETCANVQLLGALSKAARIIYWVNMELVNVPQCLSLVQMASQVHRSLTSPLGFQVKTCHGGLLRGEITQRPVWSKCALRFKLMMRPCLIQCQWLKLKAWTLIKGSFMTLWVWFRLLWKS